MTGDSLTLGDFVEDHETLPARVEQTLDCARPLVVINARIGGSSITTQRRIVERALVTSPDLILLMFYENALADLELRQWEHLERNGIAKWRLPVSLVYPELRQTAVWNLALAARQRWQSRPRLDSLSANVSDAPDDGRERRAALQAEYSRQLHELVQFLQERNLPFMLASYRSHLTFERSRKSEDLTWLEDLGRQVGIEVISLFEPLVSSGLRVEQLYALPFDGHPRPEGYAIAGHLARVIREGALRERCES